jgi:ELWxxDGT repeat protein
MRKLVPMFPARTPNRILTISAAALYFVLSAAVSVGTGPARRVKDIAQTAQTTSNSLRSFPSGYQVLGDSLYFTIDDGESGAQLWKSDGTPQGTDVLPDPAPGPPASDPQVIGRLNGLDYVVAADDSGGIGLWVVDGRAIGTKPAVEFPAGSSPGGFTLFDGRFYFSAADVDHGGELWVTDGTSEGTGMVQDLWPGPGSSNPNDLTVSGDSLYFFAFLPDGSTGLFRLKSGSDAALLIRSFQPVVINNGRFPEPIYPGELTPVGSTIFFLGTDPQGTGAELWKTDGTTSGTVLVRDINPGIANSIPFLLVAGIGKVFFQAFDESGPWLWTSDGTAAGTHRVPPPSPGSQVFWQTFPL